MAQDTDLGENEPWPSRCSWAGWGKTNTWTQSSSSCIVTTVESHPPFLLCTSPSHSCSPLGMTSRPLRPSMSPSSVVIIPNAVTTTKMTLSPPPLHLRHHQLLLGLPAPSAPQRWLFSPSTVHIRLVWMRANTGQNDSG